LSSSLIEKPNTENKREESHQRHRPAMTDLGLPAASSTG
jgi:hypothetical protein